VAGNTATDHWDLDWTGRGKVKQTYHRSQIARLSAIASR